MADTFTPPPLSSYEGPAEGFTPPPVSAEEKPSIMERAKANFLPSLSAAARSIPYAPSGQPPLTGHERQRDLGKSIWTGKPLGTAPIIEPPDIGQEIGGMVESLAKPFLHPQESFAENPVGTVLAPAMLLGGLAHPDIRSGIGAAGREATSDIPRLVRGVDITKPFEGLVDLFPTLKKIGKAGVGEFQHQRTLRGVSPEDFQGNAAPARVSMQDFIPKTPSARVPAWTGPSEPPERGPIQFEPEARPLPSGRPNPIQGPQGPPKPQRVPAWTGPSGKPVTEMPIQRVGIEPSYPQLPSGRIVGPLPPSEEIPQARGLASSGSEVQLPPDIAKAILERVEHPPFAKNAPFSPSRAARQQTPAVASESTVPSSTVERLKTNPVAAKAAMRLWKALGRGE